MPPHTVTLGRVPTRYRMSFSFRIEWRVANKYANKFAVTGIGSAKVRRGAHPLIYKGAGVDVPSERLPFFNRFPTVRRLSG